MTPSVQPAGTPAERREIEEFIYEDLLVWLDEQGFPDDFEIDVRRILPRPERVPASVNTLITVADLRRRIREERGKHERAAVIESRDFDALLQHTLGVEAALEQAGRALEQEREKGTVPLVALASEVIRDLEETCDCDAHIEAVQVYNERLGAIREALASSSAASPEEKT